MVAEHLLQRASQLKAEQVYWEGMRRQANAALQEHANRAMLEADITQGMYTDNAQELLKSQQSSALFHLQEIAQELERIRQLAEAEAREAAQREQAQREQELKGKESLQRDEGLKELAVEERQKAEALQKEDLLKAEAVEKERQEKEFFEKKESERLEALAKEEREKQTAFEKEDRERLEVQQKEQQQSEVDFLAQQLADLAKEKEYIEEQIASEWDYVDQQIQEEMEYNVGQALEAVAEAGFEIGIAIANPVSQKEAGEFLEAQKQQLKDFISDEVFQAAPAENKEMWLQEKFREQLREAEAQFGDRKDDWGNREKMLEGLAELQKATLEAAQKEHEIEKKLQADIEELKRVEAETKERLEKANIEKEVAEGKMKQAEELAQKLEAQLREQAEKERQAIWEREQRRMQEIEAQKREEAAREEARAREEAARAMRNTLGF